MVDIIQEHTLSWLHRTAEESNKGNKQALCKSHWAFQTWRLINYESAKWAQSWRPTFDWYMLIDMKLNRTGHGSVLNLIGCFMYMTPGCCRNHPKHMLNRLCTSWTMQCGGETCYTCNCMQITNAQHTYLHAYINNDYYYSYILLNRIHIACMPCVCPYAKLRTYHSCHGRTHVHYKDKAVVCTHEPRPGMWHYTCLRD